MMISGSLPMRCSYLLMSNAKIRLFMAKVQVEKSSWNLSVTATRELKMLLWRTHSTHLGNNAKINGTN